MATHFLENTPATPARACCILAHGAGAAMDTPFMDFFAEQLAAAGIRVLRFEFPYMAQRRTGGSKRPPNRQAELLDSWCRAVADAKAEQPLFIGGKSMGGRMASLLADQLSVAGLICLGYPFHPPGKPEKLRTEHLQLLRTPTLIVQGERDTMGTQQQVQNYGLAPSITLHFLPDGDHSFKPRKKSGYSLQQHLDAAAKAFIRFVDQQLEK